MPVMIHRDQVERAVDEQGVELTVCLGVVCSTVMQFGRICMVPMRHRYWAHKFLTYLEHPEDAGLQSPTTFTGFTYSS